MISALFDTGDEDNPLLVIAVIVGIAALLLITSPIWLPILTFLAPFLLVGALAVGIYIVIDDCHQDPPKFDWCPGKNETKQEFHEEESDREPWNSQ